MSDRFIWEPGDVEVDDGEVARAAGMLTNPGGTERLHQYWVHGEGAAKIRWGAPGDFDRCVLHLSKYIRDPKGYCANAHHAALGIWPATHAKELSVGRAAMATDTKAKPYGDVTYADPRNSKYPIDTEAHCRAAWAYINMPKNAAMYPLNGVTLSEVKDRIRAAMKRIGADVGDSETASDKASVARFTLLRPYPLEECRILRSADGQEYGSGRVVEAYAAVFDEPVEIRDRQGHYEEIIDRSAFDQTLTRLSRARGGIAGAVRVLYNHGRTMGGAEAPEFQRPIGKPLEIRPEGRGLLTRTEYNTSPLAEEILENIKAGSITGQSFEGPDYESSPPLRGPGDKYRARNGVLPKVRRMILGLQNYGPALYAAYPGAEFLGVVRMNFLGDGGEPEPGYGLDEDEAPAMEGELTGGVPEDTTSARYHQHALYRLRAQEQRERIGLHW